MVEFFVKTKQGAKPLKSQKASATESTELEQKSQETIAPPKSRTDRGRPGSRPSEGRRSRGRRRPESRDTPLPPASTGDERHVEEQTAPSPAEPPLSETAEETSTSPAPTSEESAETPPRRRRRRRPRGRRRKNTPETAEATPREPTAETPEETRPAVEIQEAGPEAPQEPRDETPWSLDQFEVEPAEGKTRFHDLDLPLPLMHALHDVNFQYCTPIQAAVLPHTLEGSDCSGKAQTGTGKSAAFLLTILTRLLRVEDTRPRPQGTPRALVIAPTRELAIQIEKDARQLAPHLDLSMVVLFGGAPYERQERALAKPIDLVIATPGRLLDFKQKNKLHLNHVEIMVIDEADRMLDMGFIPDVRKIIHSTPPKAKRQTMLFSATLTDAVMRLASQWTRDPVKVEIEPDSVANKDVDQRVYIVPKKDKFTLLYHILTLEKPERAIVFTNRRDQAERMCDTLERYEINAALLSGAVPQNKRTRTLENFREGKIDVLVATDVAGRGLHIDGVSHVINLTLPQDAEDYVHRIGRTGRAGKLGTSISFACEEDSFYIPAIEELLGYELRCEQPPEEWLAEPPPPTRPAKPPRPRSSSGRGRSGGGRRPPRRGGSSRPRRSR